MIFLNVLTSESPYEQLVTFLTQFGSNQIIKKIKIFIFSVCLCVELHSRALGVQLGGLITFSRMNISEPPALKIFSYGPRLTSESLGLIACSRKKKCKFYETSFLTRFWYYFANILSHRQNFSKPYTLFLSLGVWYTHANFQLETSFQSRVLYYT